MPNRAVLRISGQLIVNLCKAGPARCAEAIENALPSDTVAVGVAFNAYDTPAFVVGILVESDAFAELAEGQVVPFLPDPVFRTMTVDNI